jgi:hypothetical protein
MYDDASRAGEGISGHAFRCQFLPDSIPSADQADPTHPTHTSIMSSVRVWVDMICTSRYACMQEGGWQWAENLFSNIILRPLQHRIIPLESRLTTTATLSLTTQLPHTYTGGYRRIQIYTDTSPSNTYCLMTGD